ncbi:hypothetical protein DICPUDRAFT_147528 [Dictyostelium purpureum]|uniref:Uncharacterized protein n=1 Tax=Dictyostelium purpureum TaxID=5786 RepID=F0Z8Q5_DICPU|nr:uncharacterized protein DICPUDRAFT_147528 [Dictyostelium purpureum]EGC39672.1 hypothetical protein DICPUDRAFT_147528 [Dictyostelium purpureum]|eukprot:XP_003283781.1 hypothetical protein DICPUDRAFT_147528 [Dictyostelium purpureum]
MENGKIYNLNKLSLKYGYYVPVGYKNFIFNLCADCMVCESMLHNSSGVQSCFDVRDTSITEIGDTITQQTKFINDQTLLIRYYSNVTKFSSQYFIGCEPDQHYKIYSNVTESPKNNYNIYIGTSLMCV